ncbi:hypothetical protein Ddye_029967 [Dipteronia dyeriana]|uniref:Ribulose bisphosphate carboxylase small subunit n=1 Tax=Dipteronia dyeriana TaxID=168575 RepID=A0AAD9WM82_9ROSI|nr:hypothetical protein Ddye_029967 [Dipteronia dyeriana]
MAFLMVSLASIGSINRASPAPASMVATFTGLKSSSACPVTRQLNNDIISISSNGGRAQCIHVWPPVGEKKFETLSYLPPLSPKSLSKEVDYLLRMGWVPCLKFELEHGFVYREHKKSMGYILRWKILDNVEAAPCLGALTQPKFCVS